MKILLDECVTKKLIPSLKEHEVSTVSLRKWNGLRNVELLRMTEQKGFDIFLTIDKKIKHQQNIPDYNLIVIIIDSHFSAIEILSQYIPDLLSELNSFTKGNFYIIKK
ncbi:MAG: hypothetical protein M3R36_01735 [Bacteroidota bacterium]|nr:hypothetical protein [Bacteroidota bacterium]